MINNMIFPMQSNVQFAKNGENNVGRSKYKFSQVHDFRSIMSEAKDNIESNVSKKVYKKQEDYRKSNKFDSVEEKKGFHDHYIKNDKSEKKIDEAVDSKAIEEPIDEEKNKVNNENKAVQGQMENILSMIDSLLKNIKVTNQESNNPISDEEITEVHLLMDKIKVNGDFNSLLSSSELDNIINKLKEILFVNDNEFKNLPQSNSIMGLQSQLESLLNVINKKDAKDNQVTNLMQTEIIANKDSNIAVKYQDGINAVNTNRPRNAESNNEDFEVKTANEDIPNDKQSMEKVDGKIQIAEKTDAGKLIQKVLQKVIIEPKESFNSDVKLDNIIKNGIDKANLVDKPAPVYKMEVLKQIVEKAQILLGDNMSEMDMQLKPENLGKLSLKLVIEKGLMSARFIAESQQVKEVIESNFNQLKDMLQQKGLDVQSFSVSVGQQNKDFNDNNGYRAWKDSISNSVRSKLSMNFEEDMTELFVETKNPYEYHEGTVDYKA